MSISPRLKDLNPRLRDLLDMKIPTKATVWRRVGDRAILDLMIGKAKVTCNLRRTRCPTVFE